MKKLPILVAVTLILVGCVARYRDFSDIYSEEFSNVSRLVIERGKVGGGVQQTREITDEQEIRSFFDLLDSTRFVMTKDQSPWLVFLYKVDIYEDNENRLRITFTDDTARLNSTNYWLDKEVGKDLKFLFGSGVEIDP